MQAPAERTQGASPGAPVLLRSGTSSTVGPFFWAPIPSQPFAMTTAANTAAIAALQADLALLKGNHTALVSHVDGGFVAVHDLDVAWLVICGERAGAHLA